MSTLVWSHAGRPASAAELRRELLALADVPPWSPEVAAAWWPRRRPHAFVRPVEARAMGVAMTERS